MQSLSWVLHQTGQHQGQRAKLDPSFHQSSNQSHTILGLTRLSRRMQHDLQKVTKAALPAQRLCPCGELRTYWPTGRMGGEPNLRLQQNSLWLYQNDVGEVVCRAARRAACSGRCWRRTCAGPC